MVDSIRRVESGRFWPAVEPKTKDANHFQSARRDRSGRGEPGAGSWLGGGIMLSGFSSTPSARRTPSARSTGQLLSAAAACIGHVDGGSAISANVPGNLGRTYTGRHLVTLEPSQSA